VQALQREADVKSEAECEALGPAQSLPDEATELPPRCVDDEDRADAAGDPAQGREIGQGEDDRPVQSHAAPREARGTLRL
jgi:hypothetical protein